MGKISPDPTRCPPGAERRLVPKISNLKPQNSNFQHLLDDVLKDYRDFARPLVNNIILTSGGLTYQDAMQNHVKHLRLVLQRLREKKFAVSADKAHMLVQQVESAGHVMGYGVKRPMPGKILCLGRFEA